MLCLLHSSLLLYLATIQGDYQICEEVLNRNIPAIEPDDIMVTNSKVCKKIYVILKILFTAYDKV